MSEQSPIRVLNRQLPELCQANGYETRTFMPKFGDINERRNQLHEVIRLSGLNLIIDDTDHPLLVKVASIQSAHIQIYFMDNEDLFNKRRGIADADGKEYEDNDVRTIFYARSVLETVRKLRWTPDIVHCSGWMSALAPLYVKKAYSDTPFFAHSKVVVSIDDNIYQQPFGTKFSQKIMIDGVRKNDVRSIAGFPVGYEELMRFAIDHADALVMSSEQVNPRVYNYAETSNKPILKFQNNDPQAYLDFYNSLLDGSLSK